MHSQRRWHKNAVCFSIRWTQHSTRISGEVKCFVILQTATVIGIEMPLPLLQAIAELPEEVWHCSLAHLQAVEFLYEWT